jgi:hypothetical protein
MISFPFYFIFFLLSFYYCKGAFGAQGDWAKNLWLLTLEHQGGTTKFTLSIIIIHRK